MNKSGDSDDNYKTDKLFLLKDQPGVNLTDRFYL
jgi:hypothetical protein